MITVSNITKSFGSLQVLKGIDLHIEKGKVVSIVGPSGAGKTTLLQIMGTLDKADSGEVVIDGIPPTAAVLCTTIPPPIPIDAQRSCWSIWD